jgi:hypothetical protein
VGCMSILLKRSHALVNLALLHPRTCNTPLSCRYHSPDQERAARDAITRLEAKFGVKVATTIDPEQVSVLSHSHTYAQWHSMI